jgi:hypothetical protein
MHCWRWICSHHFWSHGSEGEKEGEPPRPRGPLVYTSWDCHEIPGLERIKQLWAKILRNIILMDYLERISSFGHLSRL